MMWRLLEESSELRAWNTSTQQSTGGSPRIETIGRSGPIICKISLDKLYIVNE